MRRRMCLDLVNLGLSFFVLASGRLRELFAGFEDFAVSGLQPQ